MGIRGSYTTAFAFDDLRVPVENLLGQEGKGFNIAMDTLNGGRIGIASQALGIAEGAFERALAYSKERKQFGQAISEFQAIQFKLADMWTRIETSKLLTYRAACLKDAKKSYTHGIGHVQDATLRRRRHLSPRKRSRSMAATATSSTTKSSGCTATPRSPRSTKGPMKCSGW